MSYLEAPHILIFLLPLPPFPSPLVLLFLPTRLMPLLLLLFVSKEKSASASVHTLLMSAVPWDSLVVDFTEKAEEGPSLAGSHRVRPRFG